MSRITLAPNASGTGTLTVAAPNTNTDRTLTLPDATTTLVGTDATQTLTNKTIAASQLTGALPAIDGSALTGISSVTLLGTLTTTSGATQTLSGLTLTSYKFIIGVFNGVSLTSNTIIRLGSTTGPSLTDTPLNISNVFYGMFQTNLSTGILISTATTGGAMSNGTTSSTMLSGIQNSVTTASTSITFAPSSGAFDAGSITIYGVK